MILLDTNVVSEPLRLVPDIQGTARIDAQPLEALFLSAITVAELRGGVALLPVGSGARGCSKTSEKRVLPPFTGGVLPFDMACTQAYAELMADALSSGLAIVTADGYIAAIAAANGSAVATRYTGPFEAVGGAVIDPRETAVVGASSNAASTPNAPD